HLVHYPADDAQHHRHHRAVLVDRDLRQFRYRAHPHAGRADRQDARLCHLGLLARYPGRRYPARSQRVAVHGADPRGAGHLHPARHQPARQRSVMVAADATIGKRPKYGSMRRDRRWALRWSYVFLVLFAVFFLMPPIYMLITSLKTSAEISAES